MSLSQISSRSPFVVQSTFEAETPVQAAAWKEIRSGKDVLIAAPTGSGKTFAAFLCAINDLVQQSESPAAVRLGASALCITAQSAVQ